jgi:uncharacterized protein YijF (DUF1287 family)
MSSENLPIIGEHLLKKYNTGDIVTWVHDLRTEKIGIILDVFNAQFSNRLFPTAKIYIMGEDKHEEVLLSSLTNISNIKD